MPWWILELATTAVLVAIALWLGPFIKRFGRAYAADVFHDNPLTGKSYIVLTDVVYYLIFTRVHPLHRPLRAADSGVHSPAMVTAELSSSRRSFASGASCSSSGSCTASTSC